jgi:hypothetical protein
MKTLFEIGNDLSDNYAKVCVRQMKSSRFDVYVMLQNSDVTIQHSQRRGPAEFKGIDSNGNSCYIAGEAYDSFDVWVRRISDVNHINYGPSSRVAENVKSFDEAIRIAKNLTLSEHSS